MYKGTIIKESLKDENIINYLHIEGVEIWKAQHRAPWQPQWWTAIYITAYDENFPEKLAGALLEKWYADLTAGDEKIIVLNSKVFRYTKGDNSERKKVSYYCKAAGVPDSQLGWSE